MRHACLDGVRLLSDRQPTQLRVDEHTSGPPAVWLHADGSTERIVVGPDLRNGERLQLFIPGNTFHTARLIGRRRWFLGASTEWPGVVPADVEIGNLDELAGKYPAVRTLAEISASLSLIRPADLPVYFGLNVVVRFT